MSSVSSIASAACKSCAIKANYHTHTLYCDGKDSVAQLMSAALEKGFTHLGYSSHSLYPFSSDWHIPMGKHAQYIKEIKEAQSLYRGKLEVLIGFEADYIAGTVVPSLSRYKAALGPDVDYIIGSVHYLPTDRGAFAIDGAIEEVSLALKECYKGKGRLMVEHYYKEQIQMLKTVDFTILGHADLIRKYNGRLGLFTPSEPFYLSALRELSCAIASWGGLVEVNTGAIKRAGLEYPYPERGLLELLRLKGVPLVLSSDCHSKEGLDASYSEAVSYIKDVGYRELSYIERQGGSIVLKHYRI